jgi:hypothetical protein
VYGKRIGRKSTVRQYVPHYGRKEEQIKIPCPFKLGQKVYVVSSSHTESRYGSNIPQAMLGELHEIMDISWSNMGGKARVQLLNLRSYHIYVALRDLCAENTYVDPWGKVPTFMKEIPSLSLYMDASYQCEFILYRPDKDEWNSFEYKKRYNFLLNNLMSAYNLRCGDQKKKSDIVGSINDNGACWASAMSLWRDIHEGLKAHPTRLFAKLDRCYLNHWSDYEEIIFFYEQMLKGHCLPKDMPLPTMKDNDDHLFFNVRLENINRERLYWYLCVIRNPAEQPGIVNLTNHFIRRGKMEPLMAYVMAHVCMPEWSGGHSVIEDPSTYRDKVKNTYNRPYPDMDKVIRHVVKCHKFLTTKTKEYIMEEKGDFLACSWRLEKATYGTRIRFKPPVAELAESVTFSAQTRKLRGKK